MTYARCEPRIPILSGSQYDQHVKSRYCFAETPTRM